MGLSNDTVSTLDFTSSVSAGQYFRVMIRKWALTGIRQKAQKLCF